MSLQPHYVCHWTRLCMQVVADYNANPAVNGILVQLPLPKGIDEQRVLDAIRCVLFIGGLFYLVFL